MLTSQDNRIWLAALYVDEVPEPVTATVTGVDDQLIDFTGSSPVLRFAVGSGTVVERVCSVVDGPAGVIGWEWQAGDLDAAGYLRGVIRYTVDGDDRLAAIVVGMVYPTPVPLR